MSEHCDYDVVIIGAGIGGLVCGCYLAKAGLKTLILEKEHHPGGYCTSFIRKKFKFDTSIHYVGGLKKGALSKIFEELGVFKRLKFVQSDPSDKIIFPNYCTYIRAEYSDTILELCKSSPKERNNINKFFSYILDTPLPDIYRKVVDWNFDDFLNEFFTEQNIKSVFAVLLAGNMGLSPSRISAFAAISFLKDFIIDPGYYPIGGSQRISDILVNILKDYGGDIQFNEFVTKAVVEDKKVLYVESAKNVFKSKFFISNADASYFFKEIVKLDTPEYQKTKALEASESVYAVYIGLSKNFLNENHEKCNVWYFKKNAIDQYFKNLKNHIESGSISGCMITFPSLKENVFDPDHVTVQIFTTAPFMTKQFWEEKRSVTTKQLIEMANNALPGLKSKILLTTDATPQTFCKYTLNRMGAAFGWASTLSQTNSFVFPQVTSIKNLFLVGHWATIGSGQGGVSTVALSGKKVSEIILKQ